MKLRNKRTGEIGTLTLSSNGEDLLIMRNNEMVIHSVKLSDLEEWEDYEEPKEYWFIDAFGNIIQNKITKHRGDAYTDMTSDYEMQKKIGNYFETKEEAEKAVEKLKAWKRLKDKGFGFLGVHGMSYAIDFEINPPYTHITFDEYTATEEQKEFYNDLMLLFGDEE